MALWRLARLGAVVVLVGAVVGCESNPGGPAAPSASASADEGGADSVTGPAKGKKVKAKGHGSATGGMQPASAQ